MTGAPPAAAPLAIICGGGSLPLAVAGAARRQGRGVVLFALRGWAEPAAVAAYPHHWVRIGQLGRFCRSARREGCRDVVFIGSIVRPSLWQIWPDLTTLRRMPRIIAMFRGGDDHLLSGLAKLFEDLGFRPVGAHEIAPEILLPEGVAGRVLPSAGNLGDIALGLDLLRTIGRFDIGQATIVADGHVLAVEAAGTDECWPSRGGAPRAHCSAAACSSRLPSGQDLGSTCRRSDRPLRARYGPGLPASRSSPAAIIAGQEVTGRGPRRIFIVRCGRIGPQ